MTFITPPPSSAAPDAPDELQLDLLVDDELADADRRELLIKAQHSPYLWRSIAMRFLTVQVEHRSVRAMLEQRPGATRDAGLRLAPAPEPTANSAVPVAGAVSGSIRPAENLPTARRGPWRMGRLAAAALLVCGLAVAARLLMENNGATRGPGAGPVAVRPLTGSGNGSTDIASGTSASLTTALPGAALGLRGAGPSVTVPVFNSSHLPAGYPFEPLLPGQRNHIVIVRQHGHRAVAFPVRVAAYEKVY